VRWLVLAAALAAAPGPLQLPVRTTCISSPFGPRRLVGPHAATMHYGIDLPAPAGAHVHAAAAGTVRAIRHLGADGLEIDLLHKIPHGGNFVTRYAHLGSIAPRLAEGQRQVAAGQWIGVVGRSGITYGPHLHFEVHIAGHPVDPAPFFHLKLCR